MKKTPLTAEEHVALGKTLKTTGDAVRAAFVRLGRAYPCNGKVMRMAGRVDKDLRELRNRLDDAACQEHPGKFDAHWYYGPSPSPGST